ncbi:MAG: hypothetical protein FWE83_06555 [Oscillospiraceae bacterium]|nr:hypothetical protein [Oscillospiraceae bacterium]
MYNQFNSISAKLRNAAKLIAAVIGGGGALLFIITLIAAGSYGGITFWAFIAAAVPCTIYIFLAWLVYHLINIICDTYDNTNVILKRVDKLHLHSIDAKSNENTPVNPVYNTVTTPTTIQDLPSTPIPASVQVPIAAQKVIVKPKPTFDSKKIDVIELIDEENTVVEVQAEDTKPLVITETDVVAPPEEVVSEDDQIAEAVTPITDTPAPSVIFCRECGFSYDKEGNFCPQCGTKNDMKS